MKNNRVKYIAFILLLLIGSIVFAQPQISEKKEIAIFKLGYYGWNIPAETLGTIDIDIQRVFLDLGRFDIFGMEKRFASDDVDTFIQILKDIKERNFELPEKYQFYEAFLTEAEFERLIGAFIIAVPVVTSFNSQLVDRDWKTNIKTNVSFIDVASGKMLGIANVETSGTSRETQYKSIQTAIDNIPAQLQYEIRSIPAFTLFTRVLGVVGDGVKIQMGKDMGIKVGDEYAVVSASSYAGLQDDKDVGLVVIKNVGQEVSTGSVRYSSIKMAEDVQLREIPRLGADLSVYGHTFTYIEGIANKPTSFLFGLRTTMTRGFYDFKPYAAFQILGDIDKWLPLSAIVGMEYSVYLGRLEFGARAGIAGGSNIIIKILESEYSTDDDPWFTHYGASGGAYLSWLLTRDIKVFGEVQVDYLVGFLRDPVFGNYGGYQFGGGITIKM